MTYISMESAVLYHTRINGDSWSLSIKIASKIAIILSFHWNSLVEFMVYLHSLSRAPSSSFRRASSVATILVIECLHKLSRDILEKNAFGWFGSVWSSFRVKISSGFLLLYPLKQLLAIELVAIEVILSICSRRNISIHIFHVVEQLHFFESCFPFVPNPGIITVVFIHLPLNRVKE